ncbi:hypothetical protein [Mesorhizobium sp.]|uniref:hypothetical protein n=1 Tax=Mesorhizobium sp. TaxID=1871066 RepID=UPI003BA920CE
MTSIYNAGTVSVSNGNAVVAGSGTAWAVALVKGGSFSCAGMSIPIVSVDSDVSLTLAYPWPGADAAGAAYAIARENSDAANVVDLYDRLSKVLLTLSLAGINPNASGSLVDRNALTLTAQDKGYIFLRAELGVAFAFYRWTGTAWDGPFPVAGEAGSSNVTGTSATSLTIGTGTRTFTVAENSRGWSAGARLRASSRASGANFMEGVVTSYAANTLVLAVDLVGGSGTKTDWNINLAGQQGASGSGAGDVVGPASAVADRIARFSGTTGKLIKDGGLVATADLAIGSVANDRLADMVTQRIKGRATTGTGAPEDLTLSQLLDMIGSPAPGDILFRGASGWQRLPKGTALQVLRQNTALTAPEWGAAREILTANRAYYVRTDGSDANNGLANAPGGAFQTIQKAFDTIKTLDLGGFSVTIQVGAGTYTGSISVSSPFLGGSVTLLGDTTTPANCTISHSSYGAFAVSGYGTWLNLAGFKIQNSAASALGQAILISNGAVVSLTGNMDIGACTRYHFEVNTGGTLSIGAGYTVSGDSPRHWSVDGANVILSGQTITMSGTRAFSGAFASCTNRGGITIFTLTKVGTATGKYYDVTLNGVINAFGSGATALFGGTAGTTATGGQYA